MLISLRPLVFSRWVALALYSAAKIATLPVPVVFSSQARTGHRPILLPEHSG